VVTLLLTLGLVSENRGFLFDHDKSQWNDLKVHWSLNPLNTWKFDHFPLTTDEAVKSGAWKLKDDFCQDKSSPFRGYRYTYQKMSYGEDHAAMVLYDKNGYVAGLQTHLEAGQKVPTKNQDGAVFIKEADGGYTLTVYFVDPSKICQGRSKEEYEAEGTGTGFYIQTGPNPEKDFIEAPKLEEDATKNNWVKGTCGPLMGMHYWLNVHKDSACDNIFPFFILYNDGKLNAFAFVFGIPKGKPEPYSPRWEDNTNKVSMAMQKSEIPTCWLTDPETKDNWIVMHVFTTNPLLNSKCIL